MHRTLAGVVCVIGLAGCMPQPQVATVPEPPEPPMVMAQQACDPIIQRVEVPVPVPMPGQWKDEAVAEAVPSKAGFKRVRIGDGRGINSVQQYQYMEGALYQVVAAVGTATTILLAPGEYFNQAIIGDQSKWKTGELTSGSGDTLRGAAWVSCSEVGSKTNLTITGSKHLYLLELRCTEGAYHAAVSWAYAATQGVGMIQGTKPAPPGEASLPAPAPMVTPDAPSPAQYTMRSNRHATWQPTRVYDTGETGKQTYIVFPRALATTDAPVLYVRTVEGTQSLVNYRARQGYLLGDRMYPAEQVTTLGGLGEPLTYYQLDTIADVLELRSGEKKPTVVTVTRQP